MILRYLERISDHACYVADYVNYISTGVSRPRRCQVCEIFLKWNGLWCPCCGYRLRTRPRNSKFKAELRANNEIDKAKSLGVYEQTPIQAHQKLIAHKRNH